MNRLDAILSGVLALTALGPAACSSDDHGERVPTDSGAPNDGASGGGGGGGDNPEASTPDTAGESGSKDAEPLDASIPACAVPATVADQPTVLSRTGCVDPADPTIPAASFFPYTVISPLWSDGAVKQRFLLLPTGGKIRVKDCADGTSCASIAEGGTPEDEGHWELPIGTVLMKTFAIDGKLVETRLLMRFTESTWRGFSYEWDDAETEAILVPDGKNRDLGNQTWHYPSPAECLQCHTSAAGRTLGLTTRQLDTESTFGGTPENQIDHLESLGVFESEPPRVGAYPDPVRTDAASLDDRARAYLAVNCSICHRPGGALDDVDLRYSTPFAATRLCDEPILRGTGDPVLPQTRLTPGDPDASSLAFRMHDTGSYRMPKIGSSVVDADGTAVIDAWIRSITACP